MGKYEAVATQRDLTALDALNRALRTWWQVIGAGAAVTIGDLGLHLLATGDVYSADFWGSLLKGAITAVLSATFAYAARFKAPPPREVVLPAAGPKTPPAVG